jgi:hypothetical protein
VLSCQRRILSTMCDTSQYRDAEPASRLAAMGYSSPVNLNTNPVSIGLGRPPTS